MLLTAARMGQKKVAWPWRRALESLRVLHFGASLNANWFANRLFRLIGEFVQKSARTRITDLLPSELCQIFQLIFADLLAGFRQYFIHSARVNKYEEVVK